jgi:hypothetical protein
MASTGEPNGFFFHGKKKWCFFHQENHGDFMVISWDR